MSSAFPLDALTAIERTPGQVPAYARVAEQLRAVITEHHLGPGVKLPSEPELTERFGLSRLTVREGIRVLRDDGILDSRHGTGVFIAGEGARHDRHTAEDTPMALNYRDEALKERAAGDTLLGVAVTTDDITEKAALAARASQHFAVAARFEQLHFDTLTDGLAE